MPSDPHKPQPELNPRRSVGPSGVNLNRLDLELLDNVGRGNQQASTGDTTRRNSSGESGRPPQRRRDFKNARRMMFAAFPLAAIVCGFYLVPWGNPESRSANWKYLQLAAEQTRITGREQLTFVNRQGDISFAANANFALSPADINRTLKDGIRESVQRGNMAEAERLFSEANAKVDSSYQEVLAKQASDPAIIAPSVPPTADSQRQSPTTIPPEPQTPLPSPEPTQPQLSVAMIQSISKPDAPIAFVDFVAFDACDVDGDVVEVLLDGVSYGVVKLTGEGTRINVAITALPAALTVRGVYDGGGENAEGITVGFAFRNGVFYARPHTPGEHLSVCDVFE